MVINLMNHIAYDLHRHVLKQDVEPNPFADKTRVEPTLILMWLYHFLPWYIPWYVFFLESNVLFLLGTKAERKEFYYECCPDERFANVVFVVFMRRRHTFYIMNVILPSILTSVLLLSIFFCTPGQKVQIGVVVLLSFRIFLLNVADNIPKTSDHIPLLGEL